MERSSYSLKLRICFAIAITLLIVAALLSFVLETRLLEQLKQQSNTNIDLRGNMIVAELEKRVGYTKAVTQSMASFVKHNPDNQTLYRSVLPTLLSPAGSEDLFAGGGYWPEPYQFDQHIERRSFFWGRETSGPLVYYDDYNLPANKSYHQEPWYYPAKHINQQSCYWSESYVDPYSKEAMVTCTCPVYRSDKFIGVTTVDMRLNGIQIFFDHIAAKMDGYIIVVDQNNQIISLPPGKFKSLNPRFLSQASSLFRPLENTLHTINTSISASSKMHNDYEQLKGAMTKQASNGNQRILSSIIDPLSQQSESQAPITVNFEYDPVLNQPVSASVFHVPQTYWKIIVVKSQQSIYQSARKIISELMTAACISVLFVMICAFYFLGRIVFKPIKTIATALQNTSDAPETLVPIPSVSGRELGQLVFWYNKRTQELKESLSLLNETNIELHKQATIDTLTELPNRRSFERALQALLDRNQWPHYSLFYIDLDQFKVINDTCGHLAGDQLLVEIADILQKAMRPDDMVFRLGGDEFTALIQCTHQEQVLQLAERLRQDIENYIFTWQGKIFSITTSIGVLVLQDIEANKTDALKFVDTACYAAKDSGRNTVYLYSSDDNEINERRDEMKWVAKIQAAIEANNFSVVFQIIQPVKHTSEAVRSNIEALIRLDYKGQIVPPSAFLPAAERYGQIYKIDKWMIHQVFSLLAQDERFLTQIDYCSINLSADFLSTDGSIAYIRKKLYEFRIPSAKICFEVTETQVVKNLAAAKLFLADLKAIGCRIALDDFGSGMSSYGYLHKFDVDILKIDSQFIKAIDSNKVDYAITHSIQDMARIMNLKTVAEFVANQEVLDAINEIGVDYAQGYFIAEPCAFDKVMDLLSN